MRGKNTYDYMVASLLITNVPDGDIPIELRSQVLQYVVFDTVNLFYSKLEYTSFRVFDYTTRHGHAHFVWLSVPGHVYEQIVHGDHFGIVFGEVDVALHGLQAELALYMLFGSLRLLCPDHTNMSHSVDVRQR